MKLTKLNPTVIDVDDDDHKLCKHSCIGKTIRQSPYRAYCDVYEEDISMSRRCDQCLKDFGEEDAA